MPKGPVFLRLHTAVKTPPSTVSLHACLLSWDPADCTFQPRLLSIPSTHPHSLHSSVLKSTLERPKRQIKSSPRLYLETWQGAQGPYRFATPFCACPVSVPTIEMASPTPFYRILCLVICVGLAWLSVVAKPVELPALSQHRYISGGPSQVVDGVGAVRNGSTRGAQNHLPATLAIEKPACVDPDRCRSGSVVTDAVPSTHTITWYVQTHIEICRSTC